MSVLTNKSILYVGEDHSKVHALSELLDAHGATLTQIACQEFSCDYVSQHHPDLILLDCLTKEDRCLDVLMTLRDNIAQEVIPVFAIIQDDPDEIADVLTRGAADYITEHEDSGSIMAKIKAVFGQGQVFPQSTFIDITPQEADVTTTGIRVFVIEDDPLLRNLLTVRMDKSRFPYEFSTDGSNVVPAMKQFKPDVVVLDLMLPGRTGFEILADIRADDMLKDIPVIVFSNKDGQDDRVKAEALGVKGYYVKALTDLSELIETIESLVK